MASTRIALSAKLLDAVIQKNRETLIELHFKLGMSRYEKENQLVEKIILSDGLELDCAALPDDDSGVSAIRAVLDAIKGFLEIFLGAEDAERRISEPIAEFASANAAEITQLGLWERLPQLQKFAVGDATGEMGDIDERGRLEKLFSDLFTTLLATIKPEHTPVYKNKLTHSLGGAADVDWVENEVVVHVPADAEMKKIARSLTQALDSLIELGEGYFDRPKALEEAIETLTPRVAPYSNTLESLGISEFILRGALAKSVRFGIEPLDGALRGGMPKGASFALQGPPGWEKHLVSLRFAKEGLDTGGSVILLTSTRGPDELLAELASLGVDCGKHLRAHSLVVVDFYSSKRRSISGLEEREGVIACSEDLTNLGLAIGAALQSLRQSPVKRAVIDFASISTIVDDFETVYEFMAMLKARLSKNEVTSLVIVTRGVHKERELRQLQDTLDGVINVARVVTETSVERSLKVVSVSKGLFDPLKIDMSIDRMGATFTGGPTATLVPILDHVDRTVSGVTGLDMVFGTGFPSGYSVLVQGPPGLLRDSLRPQFGREGLAQGGAVLIIVAGKRISEVISDYKAQGTDLEAPDVRGRVAIVDWHSYTQRRVIGVERDGNKFTASNDMTHLGVAIDAAMRHLGKQKGLRCVCDATSAALRTHEASAVLKFILSLQGKLGDAGATSLFTIDKGAHDDSAVAALAETFDCIFDIEERSEGSEMIPLSVRGMNYDTEKRSLTMDARGASLQPLAPREEPKGDGLRKRVRKDTHRDEELEKLAKDLEKVTAERQMYIKRIDELSRKESEVEKAREDFARRLEEFNKEIARRAKQKERLDQLEHVVKEREEEMMTLARVLKRLDELLEHLPDDKVDEFAKSDEFKLYEKIMDKYLKGA